MPACASTSGAYRSIKDGEEQLGTRTRVKIVKNKVAPPFKKAEFDIMFGEGISKIGEIIDLGVDYGIIKKAGSWFSYGDRKIGQGRDSVKEALKNDEALRDEIEVKVREAMAAPKKVGIDRDKPAASGPGAAGQRCSPPVARIQDPQREVLNNDFKRFG